jgi:hypothetical protein
MNAFGSFFIGIIFTTLVFTLGYVVGTHNKKVELPFAVPTLSIMQKAQKTTPTPSIAVQELISPTEAVTSSPSAHPTIPFGNQYPTPLPSSHTY